MSRFIILLNALLWCVFVSVDLVDGFVVNNRLSRVAHESTRFSAPRSVKMMFSGIIEEMGTVEKLSVNQRMVQWDGSVGEGVELTVRGKIALVDAYIGCSIAVNGVCLTAISHNDETFTVGLAPETLRRSNLGKLTTGSKVNLERALKADGRNSGHFVQGHVDCEGNILNMWREGDSLWVKVGVTPDIIKYIVPKGFVAIDGTSLTICEVNNNGTSSGDNDGGPWFTFMLIAHTQECIIVPQKKIGETVNIEVDVLAKMVERSLAGVYASAKSEAQLDLADTVDKLTDRISKLEAVIAELTGKK